MLQVTESGRLRGFSFEKRGKAYRYVEDWLLNATANDDEMETDYSEINLALEAVNEGEGIVDSIAKGRGVRKLGLGVVIRTPQGRKFKIGSGRYFFYDLIFF